VVGIGGGDLTTRSLATRKGRGLGRIRRDLLSDDRDLAAHTAAGLILRCQPGESAIINESDVQLFDTGWDFRVFKVGNFAVRVARTKRYSAAMPSEIELLNRLRDQLPTRIPDPVLVGTGVSVAQWIPGAPLSPTTYGGVTSKLADTLAALHRISKKRLPRVASPSPTKMRSRAAHVVIEGRGLKLQGADLDVVARGVSDDTMWDYKPELVHADISTAHILLHYDGAGLAGIIDWTDARFDDPAIDIAGIEADLGVQPAQQLLDRYQEQKPIDRRFYDRVRFRAAWAQVTERIYEMRQSAPAAPRDTV
jgi:macrolide phosphotransferase